MLLAYGDPGPGVWMFYLAIILHGVCFDFFFVTGQLYTDQEAPPHLRSTAQGFITAMTYGFGMLIGSFLSGYVLDYFSKTSADGTITRDWTGVLADVRDDVVRDHAARALLLPHGVRGSRRRARPPGRLSDSGASLSTSGASPNFADHRDGAQTPVAFLLRPFGGAQLTVARAARRLAALQALSGYEYVGDGPTRIASEGLPRALSRRISRGSYQTRCLCAARSKTRTPASRSRA